MRYLCAFFVIVTVFSCANDIGEVNKLTKEDSYRVETAEDVKIIYSDSARVLVKMYAPKMVRTSGNRLKDEFPEGVRIEFLDEKGRITSKLVSDYAIRDESAAKFITRGKVKFYNAQNDALESSELIWDQDDEILETDKFIRIVQPKRGDTSYGYGFKTNPEFNRFEIKKKTKSKFNIERFKKLSKNQ